MSRAAGEVLSVQIRHYRFSSGQSASWQALASVGEVMHEQGKLNLEEAFVKCDVDKR